MSLSFLPRLPLAAAALCAALALSACGGSDNKSPNVDLPPTSGTPPPTTPVASDSFFDFVLARVNTFLDNEEPAAIDGLTEGKPENTEPVPVN
jgi:hypothetical protein